MKTLLKTLFWIVVISIFLFSDNKTISTARKFCAVNGKATYDVVAKKVTGWVSDGSKKATAYFEDHTKK
jgi:hypothetical protein